MIPLPNYRAVVDKDEADRLRANARELGVEANVEVEEDRVVVIGYGEASDYLLVVRRDGRSDWVRRSRVTFEIDLGGYPWHALVREG